MKIKTLANGLELRHSGDGYSLLFTPLNGKGGALLNMSHVAIERGNITKRIMLNVMEEVIDEECAFTQNERLRNIITERDTLMDDIYDYGKSNPTTAPQCITDLVERIDEGIE